MFFGANDVTFVRAAFQPVLQITNALLLTDDPALLPEIQQGQRTGFDSAAPDRKPIDAEEVHARLRPRLKELR